MSTFLYPLIYFCLGLGMVLHNLVLQLKLSKPLLTLLSAFPLLHGAMERRIGGPKHKGHGLRQE